MKGENNSNEFDRSLALFYLEYSLPEGPAYKHGHHDSKVDFHKQNMDGSKVLSAPGWQLAGHKA